MSKIDYESEYECVLDPPHHIVGFGLAANTHVQERLGDQRLLPFKDNKMIACRTIDDAIWLKLKGAIPASTKIYEIF